MPLTPQRKTTLVIVAVACGVIGLGLLALSAWYGASYLADSSSNPSRSEYLEGVLMALFLAFPPWLGVSAAAYPLRSQMPRRIFLAVNIPAAALGLMTLGFFLFILAKIVLRLHAA